MDLVYMPELLSYGSFRAPVYRDYEQPWNQDYFNCGKSMNKLTRHQQEQLQQQLRASQKEHCHLCKENKRRSLGAYIRSKSRSTSCGEIHEEEDEEGEEEKEVVVNNKYTHNESAKTDKALENKSPIKSNILSKLNIKLASK